MKSVKLYSVIVPLLIFGAFGYFWYQADRTSEDGKINKDAFVEEVKEDYHDVEEFFASGDSANHDNYNQ